MNLKGDTVIVNPFVPNAPFLYPLKTSENLSENLQGEEKGCVGNKWVNSLTWWCSLVISSNAFSNFNLLDINTFEGIFFAETSITSLKLASTVSWWSTDLEPSAVCKPFSCRNINPLGYTVFIIARCFMSKSLSRKIMITELTRILREPRTRQKNHAITISKAW